MRLIILTGLAAIALGMVGCNGDESPPNSYRPQTEINVRKTRVDRENREEPPARVSVADSTRAAHRLVEEATTGPTVIISGKVLDTRRRPVTSATMELWAGTGEYGRIEAVSERLDAVDVRRDGSYSLQGKDVGGLRVFVKNAPFAITEVPDNDYDSTASTIRYVNKDFLLPDSYPVTGKVIYPDGSPVAGAVVSLQSDDLNNDGWFFGNQKTTVSMDGSFVIPDVAEGTAKIGATAVGNTPIVRSIRVPTSEPVSIVVTTGTATLNGSVIIVPAGVPLTGGMLHIASSDDAVTLGLYSDLAAMIESDGTFHLANVPTGTIELAVTMANGSPLWPVPGSNATFTVTQNQALTVAMRVFEGYSISGTLYDKDTSESLPAVEVVMRKGAATATSNQDGHYSFQGLKPEATYALRPILSRYETFLQGESRFSGYYEIKPTTSTLSYHIDLPMQKMVSLCGKIENAEGFLVSGATVRWNTAMGQDRESISDGAGEFEIFSSPFTEGLVEVDASGYAAYRTTDTIKVALDDIKNLGVKLDKGGVVEGRVLDPDGQPVVNASIESPQEFVMIGSSVEMSSRRHTRSDINGNFKVTTLPESKVTLQASAPGYTVSPGKTINVVAGETQGGIILQFQENPEVLQGTITGRVVDANGKGLMATIQADMTNEVPTDPDGRFEIKNLMKKGQVSLTVVAEAYSPKRIKTIEGTRDLLIKFDDQVLLVGHVVDAGTGESIGNFELQGYGNWKKSESSPGEFGGYMRMKSFNNITITAPGHARQTFKVKAPDKPEPFHQNFKLSLGGSVKGQVVYAGSGKPAGNVTVAAYDMAEGPDKPVGSTITSADGSFLIAQLPPVDMRITALPGSPFSPAHRTVKIPDGSVAEIEDIEISSGGSIEGVVVRLPKREPVAKVFVNINGPEGFASTHAIKTTDDAGRYRVDGLAAGTYQLIVNSRHYKITLDPGANHVQDIEFGTVAIRGTVTQAGKPAMLSVELRSISGDNVFSGFPQEGEYSIYDVIPGAYTAIAYTVDYDKNTTQSMFQEIWMVPDQPTFTRNYDFP